MLAPRVISLRIFFFDRCAVRQAHIVGHRASAVAEEERCGETPGGITLASISAVSTVLCVVRHGIMSGWIEEHGNISLEAACVSV